MLRPWHVEVAEQQDRTAPEVDCELAFLPRASRHAARLQMVRLSSDGVGRAEQPPAKVLDPAPAPDLSGAARVPLSAADASRLSFEDVSNAIAKRTVWVPPPLAGIGGETSEDLTADAQRFAARIGALEATRRLEHPAEADPPMPEGCFERYRDVVQDGSDEADQDDGHGADLSAVFNANLMSCDDPGEFAASLEAGALGRPDPGPFATHPSAGEDALGEPPAKAIFL